MEFLSCRALLLIFLMVRDGALLLIFLMVCNSAIAYHQKYQQQCAMGQKLGLIATYVIVYIFVVTNKDISVVVANLKYLNAFEIIGNTTRA